MKKAFLFLVQVFFNCCLFAQNTAENPSAYNPHEFFAQNFIPPAGSLFRSAKGVPGPAYWQNNSSYRIYTKETYLLNANSSMSNFRFAAVYENNLLTTAFIQTRAFQFLIANYFLQLIK